MFIILFPAGYIDVNGSYQNKVKLLICWLECHRSESLPYTSIKFYVLQDLRLGSGTTFRFDVRARDLGSPPLTSAPGQVTVFVRRNSNGPYFINTPYIQPLERNATSGKTFTVPV